MIRMRHSNGSIIQFLQSKGIPVKGKDRRKKQETKLINLIDFEITPLTEAEGNSDHHELNTQTRASTPRDGEENTGRKIIEIHDKTSKLIAGTITQEPLPRPCPVQKEMATYWETYQQPSNKTVSSDDNMAATDGIYKKRPTPSTIEEENSREKEEDTTTEGEQSSIMDVMDNPVVIRILARVREEIEEKTNNMKLELKTELKEKEEEIRNNIFRQSLKMFKGLREKCKLDNDKGNEALDIRVADLETQGLLESEPATTTIKNPEIEN